MPALTGGQGGGVDKGEPVLGHVLDDLGNGVVVVVSGGFEDPVDEKRAVVAGVCGAGSRRYSPSRGRSGCGGFGCFFEFVADFGEVSCVLGR